MIAAAHRVLAAVERRVGAERGKQARGERARNLPEGHAGSFLGGAKGRPWGRVVLTLPPWRALGPVGLEQEESLTVMSTRARRKCRYRQSGLRAVGALSGAGVDSLGPADRTLRLTFAVRQRLDRAAQAALSETLDEHVRSFLALAKEEPRRTSRRVRRRSNHDVRARDARSGDLL